MKTLISSLYLTFSCFFVYATVEPDTRAIPDSVGVESIDGKQVIVHQLEPKETYYGLSRRYGVSVQDLVTANGNRPLKIGETVRIPTSRPAASSQPTNLAQTGRESQASSPQPMEMDPNEYTAYIVGKGETLFAVSKRFRIPIESIKRANGLEDDSLREGMQLRVPKAPLPEEPRDTGNALTASSIMDARQTSSEQAAEFELRKNRYGIREMTERGVGVWIDDLSEGDASMLALHKNVPVGTIVKVTNPMTNHSTFVKVVGKFVDTAETQGAIIVLSRSVASVIGILDRRFQIEIAYGAPLEASAQR